jgi:hypothetical protein
MFEEGNSYQDHVCKTTSTGQTLQNSGSLGLEHSSSLLLPFIIKNSGGCFCFFLLELRAFTLTYSTNPIF